MMGKFVFLVILTIRLFAYDKTVDDKNVYYTSDHFRTVTGVSYQDSTTMENFSDKLLNAAEKTWQKEIVDLGFKTPRNSDHKKIDIYIGNKSAYNYETSSYETISNSYAGWATSYFSDNTPYFLINNILSDNLIKVTISHEFFHTIQYAYFDESKINDTKWDANIWWLEATAVLMEDEVYDDVNDYVNFLHPFFDRSYRNIEIYDGSHEYSMVIFAKYIREKYGFQIIKDMFKSIETSGSDGYYEILDQLLKENYNSSIKIALNEFAKWVSNAPKYFEEGSSYPEIKRYNITDNLTLRKGGMIVYDSLKYGWNLTTLSSGELQNIDIEDSSSIWTYADGTWFNNIGNDSYMDINITSTSKAYWVYAKNDTSNYYTYYDISDELDYDSLDSGWNFLGTSKDIDLSSLENFKIVWVYENSTWKAYSSDASIMQKINDNYNIITKVNKYSGFWVFKI